MKPVVVFNAMTVWLIVGLGKTVQFSGEDFRSLDSSLQPDDLSYMTALGAGDEDYILYWDYDNTSITFEVHVETTGWVGFGLAPSRNMLGADVVLAWVDDNTGVVHLHDRYAAAFSQPTVDDQQDWRVLAGRQTESHTIVRFSRNHVTCDQHDIDITDDTMGVIWAYHPSDPESLTSVVYHGRGRRGGRSLQLLSYGPTIRTAPTMPSDVFNIDFNMPNVRLPSDTTTYLCHAFPAPRLGQKHHVIQVEPILHKRHRAGLVHHMILYGCYHDVDLRAINTPTECYKHMSPVLQRCNAVFAGWAIGGNAFQLPEHTGLPLGDEPYPSMMMLEIHYDNVEGRADYRDSSGVRLWLTSRLRDNDAGFVQTGVMVDGFQAIPPHSHAFRSQGHCTPECLSQVMAHRTDGIRIIGALLHTHLAGIAVRVRHFRHGRELPPIQKDDHYDFNYQETRVLKDEILVLPGDHLITECTYRTTDHIIWGGLSTSDEMCIAYLLYYPRLRWANCDSRPTRTAALSFLEAQFSRRGEIIWPPQYMKKTYREVINQLNWTDKTIRDAFQKSVSYESGQVLTQCKMGSVEYPVNHQKVSLPPVISEWKETTRRCLSRVTSSASASYKHQNGTIYILSILALVTYLGVRQTHRPLT